MSAAWEGYEQERRGRRRRRKWRGRFAAAVALVILAAGGVGIERGCTQGIFGGGPRPRTVSFDSDANPAGFAVVVYNETDPLSRDLADFYAGKRGIDSERVVGLKCPITEEISREEYDETIAGPLRAVFDARHWWTRSPDRPGSEPTSTVDSNRIRFLVLMRGIPLKIRGTANYPGDFCTQPSPIKDQNAACVDSELAVLGLFTHSISGVIPNPTFRTFVRFTEPMPPGLMFTGRLDAPTGTMVRRMIDDSLAVERTGLWGRCYVDGRGIAPGSGNPHAEGDEWMSKIATEIAPRTLPTVYDNQPALFSTAFPMTEAAMYFGWYAEQPAGPFTREDFRFRPGAVACHLHSFSATSVRDPSRWWVGPLLNRGADAVLGNVYEPYLSLTTHLDVFADRLGDGYTLAESAWEATPEFSWMNTVVGDPLYRPGKVWKDLESDLDASDPPPPGESSLVIEGRAYWQAAQIWTGQGPQKGAAAMEKSGNRLHSGRIFEGLAHLETVAKNVPRALAAYEKAARFYQEPSDGVRVAISEVRLLADSGQKARAVEVLTAARKRFAGRPVNAALDEVASSLQLAPL